MSFANLGWPRAGSKFSVRLHRALGFGLRSGSGFPKFGFEHEGFWNLLLSIVLWLNYSNGLGPRPIPALNWGQRVELLEVWVKISKPIEIRVKSYLRLEYRASWSESRYQWNFDGFILRYKALTQVVSVIYPKSLKALSTDKVAPIFVSDSDRVGEGPELALSPVKSRSSNAWTAV